MTPSPSSRNGHVLPPPGQTIEQAFRAFHAANPHVYRALVRLARQWRQQHPSHRCGMKMLWERLRWELALQTDDPSGLKLNNNFTAAYSRLLMEQEPDLAGLFETRRLHHHQPFDGHLFPTGAVA